MTPWARRSVGVRLLLGSTPGQVALHEGVDVAVEDRVDVAGLDLGTQVFHHLIRLHDVGAAIIFLPIKAISTPVKGDNQITLIKKEKQKARSIYIAERYENERVL